MYINLFLSTYDRDAGLGLIDNSLKFEKWQSVRIAPRY